MFLYGSEKGETGNKHKKFLIYCCHLHGPLVVQLIGYKSVLESIVYLTCILILGMAAFTFCGKSLSISRRLRFLLGKFQNHELTVWCIVISSKNCEIFVHILETIHLKFNNIKNIHDFQICMVYPKKSLKDLFLRLKRTDRDNFHSLTTSHKQLYYTEIET